MALKLRFAFTFISSLVAATHSIVGCFPTPLDSPGTSPDGGASSSDAAKAKIPIATGLASTPEQRTRLCAAIIPKCPSTFGDPSADVVVEVCEESFIKFDRSFVLAYAQCSESATDCDGVSACYKSASADVVPGYPDVPLVNDCRAKHRSCETDAAYINAHTSRGLPLEITESRCKEVPLLKDSRKTTAEYCYREENCMKFKDCLWDDVFAQQDRPGPSP